MKSNRRNFILGSAKSAMAGSLATLPWAQNVFAADAQKKAIFVYAPDGCIPSRFHPSQEGSRFTLPDQTAPLESVKQHCVFASGLNMYGGESSHGGGAKKVLTGNTGQSMDHFLGQELGQDSYFKSIHLGVAANYISDGKFVNFQGGGIPIATNDDPLNAFKSIFGTAAGDTDSLRTASVIDSAKADLNRLLRLLGASEEGQKLSQHTEALFDFENRLRAGESCSTADFNTQGFQLPNPDSDWPRQMHLDENFETIAQLQMDVIVKALSCGMSRVASLTFSHPVSPFRIAGLSTANHDASHYGQPNTSAADTFTAYKRFFSEQFQYLISALDSVMDTDGNTLLHNSVIFFCSELGDSNAHSHSNMPFILAGNAGGELQTGRHINFKGEAHSKLLVSIANMMGVNIDRYGYTGHGLGGLTGLI